MIISQNRGPVKARWPHSIKRKERNPQQFSMSTGYSSKGERFCFFCKNHTFLRNCYWICSPFNNFIRIWSSCAWGFPTAQICIFMCSALFLITFSKFEKAWVFHHVWGCLDSKFKTWEEGKQWSEILAMGNPFWVSHAVDYFAWQDLPEREWELLMELSFMFFVYLMWWWKVLGVLCIEEKKKVNLVVGGVAHKYATWSNVFTWYWV